MILWLFSIIPFFQKEAKLRVYRLIGVETMGKPSSRRPQVGHGRLLEV